MAITAHTMWLDGDLVSKVEARSPMMGHAVQRGSTAFDVTSFGATPDGPALFRAQDHVARLLQSARIAGLDVPWEPAALVDAACAVVRASGLSRGLVRWSVLFAGDSPDLVPRERRARVAVAAQALEDPPSLAAIRVATFDDARKAPPESLPPNAKVAAAYFGPMLARTRALALGADDVLLLDREGFVAESPVANVLAVHRGALVTPPLRYILAGITRASLLEIAQANGMDAREQPLSREALREADEAFVASSPSPVVPIGAVDGLVLAQAPGPVTLRLAEAMGRIQAGSEERFRAWLTFVEA